MAEQQHVVSPGNGLVQVAFEPPGRPVQAGKAIGVVPVGLAEAVDISRSEQDGKICLVVTQQINSEPLSCHDLRKHGRSTVERDGNQWRVE